MHRPQLKFVGIIAVVFAVGVVAWSLFGAKPPVSMTVTGFVTNRWSAETMARTGQDGADMYAIVAVTNRSKRPFSYFADFSKESVIYGMDHLTPAGWDTVSSGVFCSVGIKEYTLWPGDGLTFRALVKTDEPCVVKIICCDLDLANKVWKRLPWWLVQRMPLSLRRSTFETEVIDLREPRS